MNDLTTLLREAAAPEPPYRIDPQQLVRSGRAKVRRRRSAAGLAAVACTAALLVAVPALRGLPGQPPEPAGPPRETLTPADAGAATPGEDYQVVARHTADTTGGTPTGDFVRGALPDGRVVLQRMPRGYDGPTRVVVRDGSSERAATANADVGNYLGATPTALVFGSDTRGLWLLGLDTMTWRRTLPGADLDTNTGLSVASSGDTVFLEAAGSTDARDRPLLELDLARGTAREVARGGYVADDGAGTIAWTSELDGASRWVTLRDLETGREHRFDPGTGSCVEKDLFLTRDRVVLSSSCRDRSRDADWTDTVTRVDVYDRSGERLTRFSADELGPVWATDRLLVLTSTRSHPGTYTYDLESGRFLRVGKAVSGLTGPASGTHRTVVWGVPEPERPDAATYVVARVD